MQHSEQKAAPKRDVTPVAYNIDDAAKALGISRRSIYTLVTAGKLRKVKAAGRSLIPASDVMALAEGLAQ